LDGDGSLSLEEALAMDANGDGQISFAEFMAAAGSAATDAAAFETAYDESDNCLVPIPPIVAKELAAVMETARRGEAPAAQIQLSQQAQEHMCVPPPPQMHMCVGALPPVGVV
jgi:hypothetical protein